MFFLGIIVPSLWSREQKKRSGYDLGPPCLRKSLHPKSVNAGSALLTKHRPDSQKVVLYKGLYTGAAADLLQRRCGAQPLKLG